MFLVRVITLVAVDVAPLAWHRIARFGLTCLLNTMRVFNVINGLLLAIGCYFAFQLVGTSITKGFLAFYLG